MRTGLITAVTAVLLLCLNGCIIVDPQVLNFGSDIDTLRLYVEPAFIASWKAESGESWLTTYPTSGSTSRSIDVYAERSGLLPGTYTGELKVSGEDSGGGLISTRVRVGMEVVEGWNGDIEGYIYDEATGDGIEGAVVQLHKGSGLLFETSTDPTGYYEFNLIAAQGKQYRLDISKEGYIGWGEFVEPIGGTVVQKDIFLQAYESTGLSASIEAAPTEGFAPVSVQFSAVVTAGSPPYSYVWDFDDGLSSTLQTPTHVFSTPGEFLVNLMVTDAQGDEAADSVTIKVLDSQSVTTSSSTTTTADDLPSSTTASSGASATIPSIIDISIPRLQ